MRRHTKGDEDDDSKTGEDNQLTALSAMLRNTCIHFSRPSNATVPLITDLETFEEHLPTICNTLFEKVLSCRELEGTFQRCLVQDLKQAGIQEVEQEVEIKLLYNEQRVGSRRADIILRTPSDQALIVLELKATKGLKSDDLKQLEFYMHHFNIDAGYLINFPHEIRFPDVPDVFSHRVITGNLPVGLSDRTTRRTTRSSTDATVQIVKVDRVSKAASSSCVCRPASEPSTGCTIDTIPSSQTNSSNIDNDYSRRELDVSTVESMAIHRAFVPPIASSTGEPCKWCLRLQTLCPRHRG